MSFLACSTPSPQFVKQGYHPSSKKILSMFRDIWWVDDDNEDDGGGSGDGGDGGVGGDDDDDGSGDGGGSGDGDVVLMVLMAAAVMVVVLMVVMMMVVEVVIVTMMVVVFRMQKEISALVSPTINVKQYRQMAPPPCLVLWGNSQEASDLGVLTLLQRPPAGGLHTLLLLLAPQTPAAVRLPSWSRVMGIANLRAEGKSSAPAPFSLSFKTTGSRTWALSIFKGVHQSLCHVRCLGGWLHPVLTLYLQGHVGHQPRV
ncbi:Fibrinogen Silencer-Binding Protein [Manis pentadactyla]|nr:Fibrinogen Silencer-Binding Protein [Manis pentadactyla]